MLKNSDAFCGCIGDIHGIIRFEYWLNDDFIDRLLIRLEKERKKQLEYEQQMEKLRQQEMEKEEQRRKAAEQREAARREMERQRQLEAERVQKQQLTADKLREQKLLEQAAAALGEAKLERETVVCVISLFNHRHCEINCLNCVCW